MNHQRKYRIFITEDDLMFRKMLTYLFQSDSSIELHVFEDGQSCLNKLALEPDLIILDFTLPNRTGTEMIQLIKTFNEEIEVIFLSGRDDAELIKKLFDAGAYDYILKDKLTKTRLLNALKHIKNLSTLRSIVSGKVL